MNTPLSRSLPPGLQILAAGVAALSVAACATPPPRAVRQEAVPAAPVTDVIAYPRQGQSERQLRRDRYECHLWAVRESGFDPSRESVAAAAAPRVLPDPPSGHDTAVGAIGGAAVGAVVSDRDHTAEGAAVGAVVGAVAGAASDASREARAQRLEDVYAERAARRNQAGWQRADAYRRAVSACLEGRGYTVR